jgi:hypothetical protein
MGRIIPLSCPACAAWDWKGRSQEGKGWFQVSGFRCQVSGVGGQTRIQESEGKSWSDQKPQSLWGTRLCATRSCESCNRVGGSWRVLIHDQTRIDIQPLLLCRGGEDGTRENADPALRGRRYKAVQSASKLPRSKARLSGGLLSLCENPASRCRGHLYVGISC